MDVVKIRDYMVFLCDSIRNMLKTANWSVCIAENMVNELKKEYPAIEQIEPLMSYVVDYYMDEKRLSILLIPLINNGKFTVAIASENKEKLFELELNPDSSHEQSVRMHEYIKLIIKENENER